MLLLACPVPSSSLLALCCAYLLAISQCHAQTLKSLITLSQDLDAKIRTSAIGNVNVVETSDNKNISLCYLPYLDALSDDDDKPFNALESYAKIAALSLALEHLNTGNGKIVPELNGINDRCPLKFYSNSFDTKGHQAAGLNHIINLTDRTVDQERLIPCAILGAARSTVSISSSIVSSLRGFPQISPQSTATELDDKVRHKLFGRTIPNNDGAALALLAQLTSWDVDHVAVLHINDAYGNDFVDGIRIQAQSERPDLTIETVNLNTGASDTSIYQAIQQLKETQYTYFYAIVYPSSLFERVMKEAYDQQIAGTGLHTWLSSIPLGDLVVGRNFSIGDPLVKAYRGTGILTVVGGISAMQGVPGAKSFDGLGSSVRGLNTEEQDVSFLNKHLPKYFLEGSSGNRLETVQGDFLTELDAISPFLYDAAVALGLAACELMKTSNTSNYFTGEELYQTFVNTKFQGTTGFVDLDPDTGTRIPTSALFSLTNFVDDEYVSSGSTAGDQETQVRFRGEETDYFHSGEWVRIKPYTFNDGTHNAPLDLPAAKDSQNVLDTGLKSVGFILCAVIFGLAIFFGGWTYYNRELRVVRASQPIFLYIISAGTLLMGASIMPLSIGAADITCMAFPWLLAVGFSLTFSALFTKTSRIKQIMRSAAKYKRLKLTARDVMKPMIALLSLNIIVLTVWTVIDPLEPEIIMSTQDRFGRPIDTHTVCNSRHNLIFMGILGAINLGSVFFSLIQAYQARNISTELSESTYIFRVLYIFLYGAFLAVPVLIIARENAKAYYFVWVGLIFVICSSVLFLIFLPKILAARRKEPTETNIPPRWQMLANEATAGQQGGQADVTDKDVEDCEGIQIHCRMEKAALEKENLRLEKENIRLEKENIRREKENHELKHLCMTLSRDQGADGIFTF